MSREKVNRLVIRTPEGCSFSLLLAGPVTRFLAWLIDLFCVIALLLGAQFVLGFLMVVSPGLAMALSFLVAFVIAFGYGILLEWLWRGKTIGKRVFGLRVMDEHGLRLRFSQVVIRNLLRFADMLPPVFVSGQPLFLPLYGVGGLTCLLTRRSQRLGDLAAGTVVVRSETILQPDLTRVLGDKYNSFRDYPHLEARLRQHVSPEEARIALQAVLRRDELDPDARIDLFDGIASHFRSIAEFPQQATDGLSDEQYVRNVVDTLFRSQLKQ